jgi:ubiquinone/menaquinone biosynthesis C-methylase UbiE
VVRDYIGNFSKELEDNTFDCIFSISVLEHVPQYQETINNIIKDINRLLKKDAFSVHAIDCVMKNENFYWKHPIVDTMFALQSEQNLPTAQDINKNDDFYYMSEKAYNKTWKIHTKKNFSEHGKAFSVNVIYQK